MKRLLLALVVLGAGVIMARAAAQTKADMDFHVPVSDNRIIPPSLDYHGVDVSTTASGSTVVNQQGVGTTSKLFFTGAGVFYDVFASSGASTSFVWCFDAAAASEVNYDSDTLNLVAVLQRATTQTVSLSTVCGGACRPIRIQAGLVCNSTVDSPYWPVFTPK